MSAYEEIIETSDDGRYRVKLVQDYDAEEPYDDGQSPILRYDSRYSRDTAHVGGSARPTDDDERIEYAAKRWGIDSHEFELYLKAFYGVTQIITWSSRDYTYVTYDSARWREYVGLTEEYLAEHGRKYTVSLDEYRAWCEGDVYGYVVEKNVTWTADDNRNEMSTWEHEDSCFGFYGYDWAVQAAKEAFSYYVTKESK